MSPLFYAVGASGIFSHYTFAMQRYNNFGEMQIKIAFKTIFLVEGVKCRV